MSLGSDLAEAVREVLDAASVEIDEDTADALTDGIVDAVMDILEDGEHLR